MSQNNQDVSGSQSTSLFGLDLPPLPEVLHGEELLLAGPLDLTRDVERTDDDMSVASGVLLQSDGDDDTPSASLSSSSTSCTLRPGEEQTDQILEVEEPNNTSAGEPLNTGEETEEVDRVQVIVAGVHAPVRVSSIARVDLGTPVSVPHELVIHAS